MKRKFNFNPGPAALPKEVLKKAQAEFLNCNDSGISVLEMSHRSKEFSSIIEETRNNLIDLLKIPKNYEVLFVPGGATGQFSAVPLNLVKNIFKSEKIVADYLLTGTQSRKAIEEAKKYISVNVVSEYTISPFAVKKLDKWNFSENAAYFYYCDNETISGLQLPFVPHIPTKKENNEEPILVCDFSSSFMSRPIDVSKFGIIFAGAQKNIGPAGVTIVIVRKDLIKSGNQFCPSILDYNFFAKANSMPNTPPCFNIYMVGLVAKQIKKIGGLKQIELQNKEKATLLYDAIVRSKGFYVCPTALEYRSSMNVCVRINDPPNLKMEEKFVSDAEKMDIIGIKGHRSVGGLRFSLYNAVSLEDCQYLVKFMNKFQNDNK